MHYQPMTTFRQNRRIIAWLACIAILLNTLSPEISHAIAAAQGKAAPWEQICSTSGSKFIPLDLDSKNENPGQNTTPMAMEHCAYCVSHAASYMLPPVAGLQFSIIIPHLFFPPLFYRASRPLFAWAASSPRGPPAFS
jgi:hypothetical protein